MEKFQDCLDSTYTRLLVRAQNMRVNTRPEIFMDSFKPSLITQGSVSFVVHCNCIEQAIIRLYFRNFCRWLDEDHSTTLKFQTEIQTWNWVSTKTWDSNPWQTASWDISQLQLFQRSGKQYYILYSIREAQFPTGLILWINASKLCKIEFKYSYRYTIEPCL